MTLAQLRRLRTQADKRSGYERRRGDKRHFTPEFIHSHPGRVFTGGESVTIERSRVKYVAAWSPYFPHTAGELARLYLDTLLTQTDLQRIPSHFKMTDWDRAGLEIPAALYFEPKRGREGKFVYVDIAACYFSLFAPWPLNVGFNHRTGAIGWPTPALEIPEVDQVWLRQEKPIRHALFGMLGARYFNWIRDGKTEHKESLGDYGAPDLHALVKLSCHAIAREAVERFDCRMWLTDAGIFPETQGLLFQLWLADRWRLGSSIKAHGNGHLYAQGDYRVGHVASQTAHSDLKGWSNLVEAPAGLAERRQQRLGL